MKKIGRFREVLMTGLVFSWFYADGQATYFNNRYDFYDSWEVAWSVLSLDSAYLMVGGAGDSITGENTIGMLKTDKQGTMLLKKSFNHSAGAEFAGSSGSLIQTIEGNFTLGGSITIDTNTKKGMLWLFDNNMDTVWTKMYGDTGVESIGYQCKQTPDSGFVLIGVTTKTGSTDIWLVKTDKSGNMEWEKTFGGSNNENGNSVILTSDGGYLISGSTESFGAGSSDAYVIKVNDTGSVEWDTTYGTPNPDCSFNFIQTSDNNFIGCGCRYDTIIFPSYLQSTPSIMKIDTLGNVLWSRAYGPSRFIAGASTIHELNDGSIVATGQSNNNINQATQDGWPIGFILKTTATGDSVWYREFQYDSCEKNEDYVRDMKPTADGGFIVTGFFVPRSAAPCNDTGTQDMWVLKLDSCGCPYPNCVLACSVDTTGVEEFQISNFKFQIYPNPTEGKFIIEMFDNSEAEKPYQVSIYDILGREIKQIKSTSQRIEVDISGYGKGMYFIRVGNKNGFYYARIVKH